MLEKICERDFVDMIIEFVNQRGKELYTNRYKAIHLYNYCIEKSSVMKDSDEVVIKNIVDITLQYLVEVGIIVKFKNHYMTAKQINIQDIVIGNYGDNDKIDMSEKSSKLLRIKQKIKVK